MMIIFLGLHGLYLNIPLLAWQVCQQDLTCSHILKRILSLFSWPKPKAIVVSSVSDSREFVPTTLETRWEFRTKGIPDVESLRRRNFDRTTGEVDSIVKCSSLYDVCRSAFLLSFYVHWTIGASIERSMSLCGTSVYIRAILEDMFEKTSDERAKTCWIP